MKRIKESTAIALAMGMLFTAVPYAVFAEAPTSPSMAVTVAENTLTQEQAIEKAKKFAPLTDEYKLQNASFHDAKEGKGPYGRGSVWIVNFAKENRYDGGSINVVIDAKTGNLVNLDIWQREDTSLENAISREAGKVKALEYIKQYAPDKVDQVKELESPDKFYMYGPYGPNELMQNFRFVRMVNGIPYTPDGITVRVNGKGEIRGYSCNWSDNLQFPSAKPAVTAEEAKDLYQKSLALQLFYQRVYKPYVSNPQESQLVYGPFVRNYGNGLLPAIDANKGIIIDREGKPLASTQTREYKPLSEKPGAPKTSKEVTKEVAQELTQSYNIPLAGFTLEQVSYNNYNGQEHVWRFEYRQGDRKDYKTMKSVSVSIDAKTGELRELFRSQYQEGPYEFPENPALAEEQARQKAIDFVKNALPTKIDQLALNPEGENKVGFKMGPGYGYEFVRLVNGIPVRDSSFRISLDPNTGEVREFMGGFGWNEKMTFQDPANIMSVETAVTKYMENYPLQLQYIPLYGAGENPYEPSQMKGIALVYSPALNRPIQNLNAVTGEWVSDWGELPPKPVEIQDITGHWAEKQVRYFVERGIFQVKDGKVNPDEMVTRSDMIKYLVMSISGPRIMESKAAFTDVGKDDPNFQFIEEAVGRKWIDQNTKNFRPNDAMTREELADVVTAILGYAKLSEAPNTFINHFGDVPATNNPYLGDIAIVGALGIMTGSDGLFMPKQQITKAQAAVVLTRLLDQLKDKQGYPYYGAK